MSDLEINVGFTRRELRMLSREGLCGDATERRNGEWWVGIYDAGVSRSDLIALGTGATRMDALRNGLSQATKMPRCPCGGVLDVRWRCCVRCGSEEGDTSRALRYMQRRGTS